MEEISKLYKAGKLAEEMFAGNTGFSETQIRAYFRATLSPDELTMIVDALALGDALLGRSKSRRQIFREYLQRYGAVRRVEKLRDLADYYGPMEHGQPAEEDREKLKQLLDQIDPIEIEANAARSYEQRPQIQESRLSEAKKDPRKVFVVHGRNVKARDALLEFLESLGLEPIRWKDAKAATGKPTPYIHEILDAGFSMAQAAVVLLTPDDEARLQASFFKDDDADYERKLTGQPRQNVLYEAGIAKGLFRDNTVFVELGRRRPFSDTEGMHLVRLNNSSERREELLDSLKNAQCLVYEDDSAWRTAGDFETAATMPERFSEQNAMNSCWGKAYHAVWLILDLQYAAGVVLDEQALDSVDMTVDKLNKAFDHAFGLGLENSEGGHLLERLRERAGNTPKEEWNSQLRDLFYRQIGTCYQAFLKEIEKEYERT
jgi:predicted nucleotide-binding protein